MKNNIYILFIIISIFAASCEEDATNVKLPAYTHQMVIGAFISPNDTLITVNVRYDSPIYGTATNYPYETAAHVEISDGTNAMVLPYESLGNYSIKESAFPLDYAKTYFLTVTNPEGKTASASCTIPALGDFYISLDTFSTIKNSDYTYSSPYVSKNISISFTDMPNITNYYRLFAFNSFIYKYYSWENPDSIRNLNNNEFYFENNLWDDIGNNGKKFKVTSELYNYSLSETMTCDVYLLNIDENYYKFQKSKENYETGNPFVEPTLIYTNVTGGLGVFASYTMSRLTVYLK